MDVLTCLFDNRYLRLLSRLDPSASGCAVGRAIPRPRAAQRPGAAGGYGFRAQMVSFGDEAVHRLLDLIRTERSGVARLRADENGWIRTSRGRRGGRGAPGREQACRKANGQCREPPRRYATPALHLGLSPLCSRSIRSADSRTVTRLAFPLWGYNVYQSKNHQALQAVRK